MDSNFKEINTIPSKDETTVVPITGTVTNIIGSGKHAQESIVWLTIRWCFISALGITAALFLYGVFSPFYNPDFLLKISDVSDIWSGFFPIITLSIGYIFGKHNETG